MSLLCQLNRHAQSGDIIANEGRRFSRCRRCSSDLVEQGRKWVPAPKGFRIVWRPKVAAEGPESSIDDQQALPAVVEIERKPDRRVSGAGPIFGRERRRLPDRRGRFGKVETLVEREGIRITRDGAAFPVASYSASDITRVELAAQAGKVDLTWLLYAAIAALTAVQAALTGEIGLWAIALAIAMFASMKWQQRHTPDRYDILVEARGGITPVLQTSDKSFATLVHDALAAIQGQPAMTRH